MNTIKDIIGAIVILISVYQYIYIIDLKNKQKKEIELARASSIKTSKAVIRGKIAEEFIPLFPDFPYSMGDCKFVGMPIDYLVFDGMSAVRNGEDVPITIILSDVKTNTAQRSKIQNAIKKAAEEGRIRFETWKVDENKKLIIKNTPMKSEKFIAETSEEAKINKK